jgi:hypothetical protein
LKALLHPNIWISSVSWTTSLLKKASWVIQYPRSCQNAEAFRGFVHGIHIKPKVFIRMRKFECREFDWISAPYYGIVCILCYYSSSSSLPCFRSQWWRFLTLNRWRLLIYSWYKTRRFGHSPRQSQLLTSWPYLVAFVVMFLVANASDRAGVRSIFVIIMCTIGSVGWTLLLRYETAWVTYFATFLVVAGTVS